MRILVTGSNGQLGNEIRFLAENYPDFEFNYTDIFYDSFELIFSWLLLLSFYNMLHWLPFGHQQ